MKKDIDIFMEQQQLDALWVSGALAHNPDMVYFTGIHHVTRADLFKVRGKEPLLFYHSEMEREEAAASGLEVHAYNEKTPFDVLLKKFENDICKAQAASCVEVIQDLGLADARVAVSGRGDVNKAMALSEHIKTMLPALELVSIYKDSPIEKARATKDEHEIQTIREIGMRTIQVVARTAEFLTSCRVKSEQLLNEDGTPLRIAHVKQRIRYWLAELGLDNPEETVFSIGRDGGIPHSAGNPQDIITLGKPIVFDIFPCQAGGGFFYDFTRTWCLGYAPDETAGLYNQVMEAFHSIIRSLEPGVLFRDYQLQVCEIFKKMGHITIEEDYAAQEGYIHSLGHGIGLNVHENPFSGLGSSVEDRLLPGTVFTIEPGLYYPSKEMGVRIEDSMAVLPDGKIETLIEYPYDLVLPMRG